MKISLHYVAIMTVGCILFGCKSSEPTDPALTLGVAGIKGHRLSVLSIDSTCVQNAGILHNDAVANVRATYNFDSTFASDTTNVAYLIGLTYNYYNQTGGWSSSHNRLDLQTALLVMVINGYSNAGALWNNMKTTSLITGNVPSSEIAIISAGLAIFSTSTSGLNAIQMANKVINRADSLTAIWDSTSWSGNTGELSGSMLRIMKSSAQYWRDHPVTTTENPVPPTYYNIVQADAAGYIVGWTAAVADEIDTNGSLSPENSSKRIRAGLRMAASFSSAGLATYLIGL